MSTTSTKTVAMMVADAKSRIENLSPTAVAKELEGGQALVVDIREAEERVQKSRAPTRLSSNPKSQFPNQPTQLSRLSVERFR